MCKIHLVKTRLVNSYVVEYPDKLLVIDVAIKNHRYVLGFIENQLKRSVCEVKLITCTHDDPDHIGGIASMARLTRADVAIPYASQMYLKKLSRDPSGIVVRQITTLREALRYRAWDMYLNPKRSEAARQQASYSKPSNGHGPPSLHIDTRLKHGQTLPGFTDWCVIHTPGHSWDSCCFYHAATRSLISGDTLLGSGKQQRLVTPAIYANRRHIKQSLNTLRTLDIDQVYPGHGSVIRGAEAISNARIQ